MGQRETAAPCCLFGSEQPLELFDCEAGVSNNTAHRVFVYRIIARHRDDSNAVSHHDVLALGGNGETCLFESSNRSKMIDSRQLWYDRLHRDFHFPNLGVS